MEYSNDYATNYYDTNLKHNKMDYETMLILFAMCEKNIVRYIVLVMSMIPGISLISGWVVPIVYIFLIFLILRKRGFVIHRGGREAFVVLFVILSIFITTIIYPENAEYIFDSNNFWHTIFPCVRFFIVGLLFLPNREHMNLIGKASCIAIIIETIFVIIYMIPRGLLTTDEMSRSYQLLPNILFAVNYSFNEKKILAWFCSFVGIAYTFAMGTRGPIVILVAYLLLKFFKSTSKKVYVKVFLVCLFAGFCALFLNSTLYTDIIRFLIRIFGSVGLSTRALELILNGTVISHMAGRDELYTLALEKISLRPLFGYGVYGEWPWAGWNIHNMYLEFLIHYGIIIGSILILWLVGLVVKTYVKTKNDEARDLILIWGCFVFIRGIFGGSYLMFGVAFLVAFCLRESWRMRYDYL